MSKTAWYCSVICFIAGATNIPFVFLNIANANVGFHTYLSASATAVCWYLGFDIIRTELSED